MFHGGDGKESKYRLGGWLLVRSTIVASYVMYFHYLGYIRVEYYNHIMNRKLNSPLWEEIVWEEIKLG